MQKNVPFTWSLACSEAFDTLKSHLVQSLVLAYSCFYQGAQPFVLPTDASAIRLGAVLEQNEDLIANASWRNYSVIHLLLLSLPSNNFTTVSWESCLGSTLIMNPHNGYRH